jgi:hypothetical protein
MATIADFKYVFAPIHASMLPLDYIREFRSFRNRFTEETGITDEMVIAHHWEIFMRLNTPRTYPAPNYPVPDPSYLPRWPDRFDPDDEDDDGNGLIP